MIRTSFLIHAMNEQTTSKGVTQLVFRGTKFCKEIGKNCNQLNTYSEVLLLPLILAFSSYVCPLWCSKHIRYLINCDFYDSFSFISKPVYNLL